MTCDPCCGGARGSPAGPPPRCYLTLYYRQRATLHPFSQPCRRARSPISPFLNFVPSLSSAPGNSAPAPRPPPSLPPPCGRCAPPRAAQPGAVRYFGAGGAGGVRRSRGHCRSRTQAPLPLRPPGSTLNNSGFWSPARPVVQVFVLPAAAVTLHYSQSAK